MQTNRVSLHLAELRSFGSLLFSRCFYLLRVFVVFTQENSSIKQFAPHTITCDTIPRSTDNLRQVRLNFMTLLLSVTVWIFRCFVLDQCFLAPSWITNCFPPRCRLRPSDKFLPVLNVFFFIILLQVETDQSRKRQSCNCNWINENISILKYCQKWGP